jgi:hypothetical protein
MKRRMVREDCAPPARVPKVRRVTMEIMMEKVERKVMLEVLAPTARGLIEQGKGKEETMMKTVGLGTLVVCYAPSARVMVE